MPPIPPLHTAKLHSTNVDFAVIPPPPAAHGIGEQIVFTDDIALLANPGNVIGQHSGFCTRVRVTTPADVPDVYQCEATFKLPDGQVTARGLIDLPRPAGQTDAFAISGGTGAYDNLRGQVKVKKISETEADFEFDTHG